jgi:MFS family permease
VVIGYIYDLIGRRWTICASMIIASVLCVFIPHASPSIPLLIVYRIGTVLASSALGSHPLVNDYVTKETRGRAIAF